MDESTQREVAAEIKSLAEKFPDLGVVLLVHDWDQRATIVTSNVPMKAAQAILHSAGDKLEIQAIVKSEDSND